MIFQTNHLPGRNVTLEDGSTCLWFGGTDYLGLGQDPFFLSKLQEGMQTFGTHYGSSRQGSLRIKIYEEAESALALFAQAPASLTLSSGMLAGQLVQREITDLARAAANDKAGCLPVRYHYAPAVHPSLWGAEYLPCTQEWNHWAQSTIRKIDEDSEMIHLIFTDTIRSPWVESFDFSLFEGLPYNSRIWLIADDSHGLGVLGDNGGGVYRRLKQHFCNNLIVIGSLNKALGIPAGVIWASESSVARLRQSPWFVGASPALPAYLFALISLLKQGHFNNCLMSLRNNINYFNKLFQPDTLFCHLADYPVYCSIHTALFDYLLQYQIMGTCFSYPNPHDPPALRLVISSQHLPEDLEKLAFYCQAYEIECL
ncbi:hypothetical protein [Dyadobacter tibetensis]|uniref:hypothetical protein n=1 Tax=Dyadobacter tibetensis TaxID=1211851 RepID=UPI0004711C06|nr:hypothetical protein [Dyadobacter tibetensis]